MMALGGVLLALVVALVAVQYFKLRWARSRFPPGPTPLPFIGNLLSLKFELRHEVLTQLAKTYGNVFTIWMGPTPVVVLNGCDTLREALVSHSEEFSGRPTTPFLEEITKGNGIALTSGHTWKQQRRFGLMALRNLGLGKKILEQRIQDEARFLVEEFAMSKGKPIDPSTAITHSVSNVIAAVVFGHHFSSDDNAFQQLLHYTESILTFVGSMWARLYDLLPWLMNHLPGPQQEALKWNDFMKGFVKKEIERHKENGEQEEPQDLVDYYLNQISKDSADVTSTYNEDNMIRLMLDLFGGGTDTTAITLLWALLFMVAYPAIQEKVQKELDTVLGDSQFIQYEDRKRLPYTNAVIHETQRYCSVQNIGLLRQVIKDTTLQGFHIEKGTIVVTNLPSALYDPDHWETPHQFNPGHFLDEEGNFVTKEAFLAFSAGHRVCIGELLARTELFIFVTSLLRAFTFRLPDGVKEVKEGYVLGLTLRPHPFKICAIPR